MIKTQWCLEKADTFVKLAKSIFFWVTIWPIARIMPRKPSLIVFFGRDNGRFLDNCKYLYLFISKSNCESLSAIYLTYDRELCKELNGLGLKAELLTSIKGFWLWLRAGVIVVDSIDWMKSWRLCGSHGANILQMWHGVPLKHIQLTRHKKHLQSMPSWKRFLFRGYIRMTGRFLKTKWLTSTSPMITERAFSDAFWFEKVIHSGYPRNDAFVTEHSEAKMINVDVTICHAISEHRLHNKGLVGLYAPTFRNDLTDPFADGRIELSAISAFMVREGGLMLIKLHPWMQGKLDSHLWPGIRFVEPGSDIYPILPEVDYLVTDYSSIYFDFLLLDKPILFFAYDYERYIKTERSMYFDYLEMSPGSKSYDLNALLSDIKKLHAGVDDYSQARMNLKNQVFDNPAGTASEIIIKQITDAI